MGGFERRRQIVEAVEDLYAWIDSQLRAAPAAAGVCEACGACCDFVAYDHRLFVTGPELIYLAERLDVTNLSPMTGPRCPYQWNGACTVHAHRLAGCRIFCCDGDATFQAELTEAVLKRLKDICERFDLPYRYADLATVLSRPIDSGRSAESPYLEDRGD